MEILVFYCYLFLTPEHKCMFWSLKNNEFYTYPLISIEIIFLTNLGLGLLPAHPCQFWDPEENAAYNETIYKSYSTPTGVSPV